MDILIPTCKPYDKIIPQFEEIEHNTHGFYRIFATCSPQSASKNRNLAHSKAKSEIIIMMDDDIKGFYTGWISDLVEPLFNDNDIKFSSARLMRPDRKEPNFMMATKFDLSSDYEFVPRVPTACFAYRKKEMDSLIGFFNKSSQPFDINFKGCGWEDNAICHDMKLKYPKTKIVINNKCKLIHINEAKNEHEFFKENRAYFFNSGRKE